jgi:hypothetical protein
MMFPTNLLKLNFLIVLICGLITTIGKLNINHRVLKEGTKNTENDNIKLSEP